MQDLYLEGKRDEAMAALPDELIDTVSLCGPPDAVRERLAVFRDAGVGTLMVSPMAWTFDDRIAQLRLVAELAFESPPRRVRRSGPRVPDARARRGAGRARAYGRAADVAAVGAGGVGGRDRVRGGAGVPRVPTLERPLTPYAAAVRAARETRPLVRSFAPDVAVADILTPAPALAAELEGVPVATLVPHLHPHLPPGFPPYSIGARLPRTAAGRALWRGTDRWSRSGSSAGGASTTTAGRGLGWRRCRTCTPGCRAR